jgi:hypothetical protein
MRENYASLKLRIDVMENLISKKFNFNLMNEHFKSTNNIPKRNVLSKNNLNEISSDGYIITRSTSKPVLENENMVIQEMEIENVTSLPPLLGGLESSSSLSSLSVPSSSSSSQLLKPQYYYSSSSSNRIVQPLPTSLIGSLPPHPYVRGDYDSNRNLKGDGDASIYDDDARDKERGKTNEGNERQRIVVVSKMKNVFEKEKLQKGYDNNYRKGNNEYDNEKFGERRLRYFSDDKNKKVGVDDITYNRKVNGDMDLEVDYCSNNNEGDGEKRRKGGYEQLQQFPIKKRSNDGGGDYNEGEGRRGITYDQLQQFPIKKQSNDGSDDYNEIDRGRKGFPIKKRSSDGGGNDYNEDIGEERGRGVFSIRKRFDDGDGDYNEGDGEERGRGGFPIKKRSNDGGGDYNEAEGRKGGITYDQSQQFPIKKRSNDGGGDYSEGDGEERERGGFPIKKRFNDGSGDDYNEIIVPKRKVVVGYDDGYGLLEIHSNKDSKFLLSPPSTVVVGNMIKFMYDDKFHSVLMRQKIFQVFFYFLLCFILFSLGNI